MTSFFKMTCAALAMTAGLTIAGQAMADPATDALSACLVKSATPDDHIALARWIFGAMAAHPRVADMANISAAQQEAINKAGGELFTRLLTHDCAPETTAAIRSNGQAAIETAFGILGEAAMQDLMSDPKVTDSLGGMMKYVDQDKLFQVMTGAPAAPAK